MEAFNAVVKNRPNVKEMFFEFITIYQRLRFSGKVNHSDLLMLKELHRRIKSSLK